MTFFLSGCGSLFEKEEELISQVSVDDKTVIKAYSIGSGATTKDYVMITKEVVGGKIDTLKKVEGYFANDLVEIVKLDDSDFLIRFTDTTYFKGKSITDTFNIYKKMGQ